MKTQGFLLLAIAAFASWLAQAQGPPPQPNREAPVTSVPFERILGANQEPQNWLTYSGSVMSQRHSALTQITPANAKDLTLKWVFQTGPSQKQEKTRLGGGGGVPPPQA